MSGASILPDRLSASRFKLAWPAVLGSLLILFVRAIESFEVPALLGLPVGIHVYTSAIFQAIHQYPSQIGLASSYAITLLVMCCFGIYLQSRLAYQSVAVLDRHRQGLPPAHHRPRPLALVRGLAVRAVFPGDRAAAVPGAGVVVAAEILQRAVLGGAQPDVARQLPRGARLSPASGRPSRNSLFLSLTCAVTIMIVAAVISWVVVRTKIPGPLGARQPRVDAAGVPRHRARAVDHDLLPLHRHRHLRHDLDHAGRLCDALPAVRHALRLDLDDADPQGARGIRRDERRVLEHELPPHRAAAAEARPARRLHLCA